MISITIAAWICAIALVWISLEVHSLTKYIWGWMRRLDEQLERIRKNTVV
jgi:hypothetical protein